MSITRFMYQFFHQIRICPYMWAKVPQSYFKITVIAIVC